MTKKEAISILSRPRNMKNTPIDILEAHEMAIMALKAMPANKNGLLIKDFGELDCISRADAIQAMQDKAKKLTNEDTINGLCGAVAILFDLPSVTPIRPKGHWCIWKDEYEDIVDAICSNCEHHGHHKWSYCPNCGSYNGGASNGNE